MIKLLKEKIIEYKVYIVLIALALFLLISGYEYYEKYIYFFKDPIKINDFVLRYGKLGFIVFLALQISQVIVFFIPGEIIQIAGGFIYGSVIGGLLSLIGITIGSVLIYGISRKFGRPFVEKIISEKHLTNFEKILEIGSKKYIIFLFYVIPGMPKDIMGYFCGISKVKFKDYIFYSTMGRLPGIFISAYFGDSLLDGRHTSLIVIAVVMSLLFLIGLLRGDRIIKSMTHDTTKNK
ncbi:TVP38/TMEM64 family protein [Clostridium sp. DL1XJH146]